MPSLLQKILQMVRKTGDRVIVLDPSGEEAFVLMDLASYEKLLASSSTRLTATQTKDKIEPDNRTLEGLDEDEFSLSPSDSFAELSEENLRRAERYHLEPIE